MADETRRPIDPLSDDVLAAAYRASRKPSGAHLSPAEWERLTCDELIGADRARALAHIESCSECVAIHRSLLDLRTQAASLEPANVVAVRAGGQHRWSMAAGLAAAAALIAAVFINQPARTTLHDNTTRSASEQRVVTLITPLPQAQLGPTRTLAWQPVEGADRYELRVTTLDGKAIFTSRRDETSAQIPTEIPLSGEYFWQVIAFKGDATIAASPLTQFNVGITLRER